MFHVNPMTVKDCCLLAVRIASALAMLQCSDLRAQSSRPTLNPKVNYFLSDADEPGVVGQAQIARRAPGAGTYQAVEVRGPKGMGVALAQEGQFLHDLQAPVKVAMLVGAVYRVRITGIPLRPGEELYPTIEVIDRVYAPLGREHRYPIPIVIEEEDLRAALSGNLVTRVIYLEDSENAEPIAVSPGEQKLLDVGPTDNALKVADQFGRPVAILRIGSRVPANMQGDLTDFLYGCPPWLPVAPVPSREVLQEKSLYPEAPVEAGQGLQKLNHLPEPRLPPG